MRSGRGPGPNPWSCFQKYKRRVICTSTFTAVQRDADATSLASSRPVSQEKKQHKGRRRSRAFGPEERGDRTALQAESRKATEKEGQRGAPRHVLPGSHTQRTKKVTKSRGRFGKCESSKKAYKGRHNRHHIRDTTVPHIQVRAIRSVRRQGRARTFHKNMRTAELRGHGHVTGRKEAGCSAPHFKESVADER